MATPAENLLASYRTLANGLGDIVGSERLVAADMPDDFTWLEERLAQLAALELLYCASVTEVGHSEVDARERNTILAALRVYQRQGYGDAQQQPAWVSEIASNGEQDTPLDDAAIDELCEKVNLA